MPDSCAVLLKVIQHYKSTILWYNLKTTPLSKTNQLTLGFWEAGSWVQQQVYVRGLNICRFWRPWGRTAGEGGGFLQPTPQRYWVMTLPNSQSAPATQTNLKREGKNWETFGKLTVWRQRLTESPRHDPRTAGWCRLPLSTAVPYASWPAIWKKITRNTKRQKTWFEEAEQASVPDMEGLLKTSD